MDELDPRHGTNAGYQTHWREGETACEPCKAAKRQRQKRERYDHHRGIPMLYTPADLQAAIGPWIRMGIKPSSIAAAAGFESQRGSHINLVLSGGSNIRRGTFAAFARLAEDDFPDGAEVYADLTRQRIRSLMAIGHPLVNMPINPRGTWRTNERVKIGHARAIRDYCRAHEFQIGPSRLTQTRARNAGHRAPLAWDDPGTLAWLDGPPAAEPQPSRPKAVLYDESKIERVLAGAWDLPTTKPERVEIARRWAVAGNSLRALRLLTGWKVERYFKIGDAA